VYLMNILYTSPSQRKMRTNIEIDDTLLSKAMVATGQTTKRATVGEALRTVVRIRNQQEALRELAGIGWEGDLDAMRQDPVPEEL
jgi:Arc/MetJ family transcription regulator